MMDSVRDAHASCAMEAILRNLQTPFLMMSDGMLCVRDAPLRTLVMLIGGDLIDFLLFTAGACLASSMMQ